MAAVDFWWVGWWGAGAGVVAVVRVAGVCVWVGCGGVMMIVMVVMMMALDGHMDIIWDITWDIIWAPCGHHWAFSDRLRCPITAIVTRP